MVRCCGWRGSTPVAPYVEEPGPWVDAGISQSCFDEIVGEFVSLDTNGDQMLSRSEFQGVARLPECLMMGPEDITHLFNTVDMDHSGGISLDEFVGYMAKRKDHLPLQVQVDPQKQRLQANLQRCGKRVCKTDGGRWGVEGDGNCQFYSLSWALHATTKKHAEIRAAVVGYLRGDGRSIFEVFYAPTHPRQPDTFDGYLDEMAQDRIWGDQLTLQAAANLFLVKISVLTAERFSDDSMPILALSPEQAGNEDGTTMREIWISFAAQHYSPIEPSKDNAKRSISRSFLSRSS